MNYFVLMLQLTILYYVAYTYFETKAQRYKINAIAAQLCTCCVFVICMFSMVFNDMIILRLLAILVLLVVSSYVYRKQEGFLYSIGKLILIYLLCGLITEYASILFSDFYHPVYSIENINFLILSSLCLTWKHENKHPQYIVCILLLVLLYVFSFGLTLNEFANHNEVIQLLISGMLLGILVLQHMVYCSIQSHENMLRLMTQRYTQKENNELYNRVKEENEHIMQQVHDLKKQLRVLEETTDHFDATLDFRKEVLAKAEMFVNEKRTGDAFVDRILQTYQKRIMDAQIQINVEVDKDALAPFDAVDICSILCNLLDNAIESCEKCSERSIQLRIRKGKDSVVIMKMKNNCQGIKLQNECLVTTKDNQVYHGYGMRNIKMIANKYHGELAYDFNESHHIFTTILHLSYEDTTYEGIMTT